MTGAGPYQPPSIEYRWTASRCKPPPDMRALLHYHHFPAAFGRGKALLQPCSSRGSRRELTKNPPTMSGTPTGTESGTIAGRDVNHHRLRTGFRGRGRPRPSTTHVPAPSWLPRLSSPNAENPRPPTPWAETNPRLVPKAPIVQMLSRFHVSPTRALPVRTHAFDDAKCTASQSRRN